MFVNKFLLFQMRAPTFNFSIFILREETSRKISASKNLVWYLWCKEFSKATVQTQMINAISYRGIPCGSSLFAKVPSLKGLPRIYKGLMSSAKIKGCSLLLTLCLLVLSAVILCKQLTDPDQIRPDRMTLWWFSWKNLCQKSWFWKNLQMTKNMQNYFIIYFILLSVLW